MVAYAPLSLPPKETKPVNCSIAYRTLLNSLNAMVRSRRASSSLKSSEGR